MQKKHSPKVGTARPVKIETEKPVDYSTAANVHADVIAAAGLRNGMTPQQVHDAISRVMEARGG